MNIFLTTITFLLLLSQTECAFTFYREPLLDTASYRCIKPSINGKIIVPFVYKNGVVLPDLRENMENAIEAGLNI